MNMAWHPVFVHFPIALFVTTLVFDEAGIILKRSYLRDGAVWLLGLGLIGGIGGLLSGELAEEAAEHAGVPETLIETHETLAVITMCVFGLLFLWRLFYRTRLAESLMAPYFLIGIIGLGTLTATGHDGGSLVYEHGAGMKTVIQSSGLSADTEHDD